MELAIRLLMKLSQNIKVTNDNLQRFKLDVEREKAKSSSKIMETLC